MSSTLETRHLRLVLALAEAGGPTRAAARLHLSQSAVSHQLAELEARLGLSLFNRVRRRLELTAAGQRLLEFSRVTLAEFARVERELQRAGSQRRELLRLSTECFTCYHWLPAVLPELRRDHPTVDVRIVIEATKNPIAALLEGKLDLAIVSAPVRDRKLIHERLFDDEWVVLLPLGHRLATRRFIAAAELAGQPLFTHDGNRRDVVRLRARLAAERAPTPDVQVVPLTEAIVELVAAELGLALVSRWAVAPHEASGRIVVRRFTRAGLKERWSAVYRRDDVDRLPLARFAELLRTRPPGPGRRAKSR
ncbi:LysR family transcriptional regulator [Nannocystaceae bacterium ST9]